MQFVRALVATALVATVFMPLAMRAQQVTVLITDVDNTPLGLTSVLVRASEGDTATTRERLTRADGTLALHVGPGDVTIVARRVGFRGDSVRVRRDTLTAPVRLRLVRIPVQLATMVIREASDCALAAAADADGSLWDEVVKCIEARRLLHATYRFERRYHRVVTQDPTIGGSKRRVTDSVEVNDPAVRDAARSPADGSYTSRRGSTTNVRVFDERDLIADTFLRLHCHGQPWRDSTDGSVRIAFAPRRNAQGADKANLVRGVVVMDGATWLMRRVEYEYVRDGKAVGHGSVQYAPVSVDGSVVAVPVTMTGDLAISGRFGLGSVRASWVIEQVYAAFVRVSDTAT